MYELADGRPGLVQALGNAWGDFERPPYIRLEADDRTGQSTAGENLVINGDHVGDIKRALIFAFIFAGTRFLDFWPLSELTSADRAFLRLIVVGLILIGLMAFRALGGQFSSRQYDGVASAAMFWHVAVVLFAVIWYAIYITK